MTQFKENDFIICKPKEEKRCKENRAFEIYARIVKIDESENTAFLDKYLDQGQTHCDPGIDRERNQVYMKFPLNELSTYYQMMNEDEKRIFRDNLEKLKNRTIKDPWKSIHQYSIKAKATYEALCEVLEHENDDEYMGDDDIYFDEHNQARDEQELEERYEGE